MFKCSFCSSSFTRKDNLLRHYIQKNENKKFKCTKCDEIFCRDDALKRHQDVHQLVRNFISCDKCDAKFTRKDNLIRHLRLQHHEESFKLQNNKKIRRLKELIIIKNKCKLKYAEI